MSEPAWQIRHANTILYCRHWQRTVYFYREQLGLPVQTARHWFVEFRLHDTATLSVADEQHASIKSAGGQGLTLSLKIDDVETVRAALQAGGLDPTPLKALWGSRVFYVFDPEGNRIEFWSEGG
ncbi:MAG: VOC family protein [Thiothrix sp.]|nr:VOC family protein [Thiothrix sp.]HPQ97182.1 VOC family protein [Thiolinea sp.]